MTVWLFDCQLMVLLLIWNIELPTDFLVERHPAQSESVNPLELIWRLLNVWPGVWSCIC
jgi:hypothetical protein